MGLLYICGGLLFTIVFILMLLLLVAFLVLFERKALGLIQIRKGSNIVSFFSVLQTVADSIKLLLKEMVLINKERLFFFMLSPLMSFCLAIMLWWYLPSFSGFEWGGSTVLVVLLLSSINVYTVLWASWSSNNLYSMMSSVRAVAQMISYEVVMGLFIVMFLTFFSSMDWWSFSYYYSLSGLLVLFYSPFILMWVGIVLAELNRTPFDLVEGESELVSGYNVEYASYSFTLFFLAEYMNIWFMSVLTTILLISHMSLLLLFLSVLGVVYVRGLLPRFKFTDLIMLTWQVFLPLVFISLMFIVMF